MAKINLADIKPGMHIRILQKVKEGDKEKTQQIEGLILSRKHYNEPGATITLRRVIDGVGVEWILPLFSPAIQKVELVKSSRVRRAKLYYLRNKSSRQVRRKLKISAGTAKTKEEKTETKISS